MQGAQTNMPESAKTVLQKKINSWAEISISSLDKLFEIAQQRRLLKGEILLRPGQICKKVYFVEKGYLRTFIDKDGIDLNTDFTFENEFTTNLKSLRSCTPSDAAIQAGEPTALYEFDKDELLNLYGLSPEIESFGRRLLEQLLITQHEHANLFKIFTPMERYHYLQQNKPELLQRVSLSQLASYLGMRRETLSRIRKRKI